MSKEESSDQMCDKGENLKKRRIQWKKISIKKEVTFQNQSDFNEHVYEKPDTINKTHTKAQFQNTKGRAVLNML